MADSPTDTLMRMKLAEESGKAAPAAAASQAKPIKPKLEDPIEARIETHRASISAHERQIIALSSRREIDTQRLQGELAELTRSFEETRDLYVRSINGIGSEIAAQISKHRRLVDSDRAAMDSLLGRSRVMMGGDAAADASDRQAYIDRKIEEGVKKALEAAWVTPKTLPVGSPFPSRKRKPISRATARKAVANTLKAAPSAKAKAGFVDGAKAGAKLVDLVSQLPKPRAKGPARSRKGTKG